MIIVLDNCLDDPHDLDAPNGFGTVGSADLSMLLLGIGDI
jgi:hypothetical protein